MVQWHDVTAQIVQNELISWWVMFETPAVCEQTWPHTCSLGAGADRVLRIDTNLSSVVKVGWSQTKTSV